MHEGGFEDTYSLSHNTTFSKMKWLGVYSGPQLDSNGILKKELNS